MKVRYATVGILAVMLMAGSVFADSATSSTQSVDTTPAMEHMNELDEAHALLVKDQSGWADSNENILNQMPDVTYDLINSSSLAGTDLDPYTFVIICGDQNATFNTNVNNAMGQFEEYVDGGGWLQVHMGTNAHEPRLTLWDGTTYTDPYSNESENYMGPDGEGHPLLANMEEPYSGYWANHGYHSNYPDEALIIVETSTGMATTLEYTYGVGKVICSTTPLEHAYDGDNYTIGPLLWNMMDYCANAEPAGPVQFNLIPQTTTIPPSGGDVVYGVELISTLPNTVPGLSYWTFVTIPNGQEFGPLFTQGFTHTPNMNVLVTNIAQAIPALAPAGMYTFTGHIGFMPVPQLSDDFEFEKIGAVAGQPVLPGDWPAQTPLLQATVVRYQ